jgi:hypothetical protein
MPLPELLYKYCSLDGEWRDRTRRIISERELWFGSIDDFNDPFESRVSFEMNAPEPVWRTAFGRSKPDQMQRDLICRKHEIGFRSDAARIGMLCLSGTPDDVLMWSHYAAKHRGICLGFRSSSPIFRSAQRVRYSDSPPSLNYFSSTKEEHARALLLSKAVCWEYEDEWRVFNAIDGPSVQRYGLGSLAVVILGCEIRSDDRHFIFAWTLRTDPGIAIYQARRNRSSFELELVPADNGADSVRIESV